MSDGNLGSVRKLFSRLMDSWKPRSVVEEAQSRAEGLSALGGRPWGRPEGGGRAAWSTCLVGTCVGPRGAVGGEASVLRPRPGSSQVCTWGDGPADEGLGAPTHCLPRYLYSFRGALFNSILLGQVTHLHGTELFISQAHGSVH